MVNDDGSFLIYALDADGLDDAREWVRRLGGVVGAFKIGFQLFLREGPAVVEMVHGLGHKVFLDLKFHDVPSTVEKASREAVRMGVFMFNVHASGGRAMMAAAVRGAADESSKLGTPAPLVIAVTALTSLDVAAAREVGFVEEPSELAPRLARLALSCGLSGVVCSPLEAADVRALAGPGFSIVCPGVRPSGADLGDQSRVSTPGAAMRAGADYLVVGRPIRESSDPVAAARAVVSEVTNLV